ncbi:MAG: CPBP family intramembrane metalloprotease [Candidatus Nanopelagicales bacterium]|jgi:membrane protease YdiL (CAAX protease family)|nr:CPBP family intramembrane metalloprotease [Candidatus Nanopelagicales bacterium]MCU0295033.1 CPBP family intramembrane metalloprotease [Candidatus Nanopelagicales bacterium]MCU0298239.1 CPBP family intramembrane metalloprotease [Candidatus Nanopelagicales bacterium]
MSSPVITQPQSPYPGASDAAVEAWWQGVRLRKPSWGFPDFLIAVALWLIFSVVSGVPILMAQEGSAAFAWLLLVGVVLPWLGMAGWPWLVSRLRGNGIRLDFGLRVRWADVGWGLLFGVAALIAASVIAAGLTALFGEFDSSAGEVAANLDDFPVARFFFALAVGFGAPIVEELCYRGLLLTSLLKRGMSRWLAVVITAALFAAMHLEPIRFALLFAIGLILGWARVHRNNTTTAIVAHMTNNLPGAVGILFLLG